MQQNNEAFTEELHSQNEIEQMASEELLPEKDAEESTSEQDEGELDPIAELEKMASEDLAEIKRLFPSLSSLSHVRELDRAERFGEMREAGFSVEEALMATNYERIFEAIISKSKRQNGKSHLVGAVPDSAQRSASSMTAEQMKSARELFSGLSEREIHSLYKRATS
jgi:hypothetical protein